MGELIRAKHLETNAKVDELMRGVNENGAEKASVEAPPQPPPGMRGERRRKAQGVQISNKH